MSQEKTTKEKGLWAITKPVLWYMVGAVILALLSGALMIITNISLAKSLMAVIGDQTSFLGFELDFQTSFLLLVGLIIITFIVRLYGFSVSHLGAFKLETIIRTNMTEHLAKIPLGEVITTGTGALKKVLLDDIKNLHFFVADSTPMIGKCVITPLISVIVLFVLDWRLALVAIGVLILGMILMYGAMKDDETHRKRYEKSQSDINKAVIEFVQAMPVVRTFDDGSSSFKRYNNALERYRLHTKAWIAMTALPGKIALIILSPLPTLLAVTMAGTVLVLKGLLGLDEFIVALMVSTGMADTLMPLMWLNQAFKKAHAAAERIHEINAIPSMKISTSNQLPKGYDIEFEEVTFSYHEDDLCALKNVSFVVKERTTTALVGPSGAGKSTVAKLIPRFWDVTKGRIKIGGVDIRDMRPEVLMDTISFVFQDTFLFNDTIMNNIKLANKHATDDEVIHAAKAAQIHDFIESLPQGYETKAGDRGTNLSGGQKQRITIARAILRNAPIIVLDEATAYADPENEEEIVKALSTLMEDKTVVVIAHRLSTIKDVNQIVALKYGEVTEIGQHDELVSLGGTYADLWKNYTLAQNWDIHHNGGTK